MPCSNRAPSAPKYTRRLPAGSPRRRRAQRAAQRLDLQHHAGAAAVRPVIHRPMHVRRDSRADRRTRTSSSPRSMRPPHDSVRQRLAQHHRKQRHHRNTHALRAAGLKRPHRPNPRPPAAPARSTRRKCCGTAGTQYSRSPRTTIKTCAGVSTKCCTTPKPIARQIHHLAADQIGAVKILVVARRQFAARHADLRAAQCLRLIAVVRPRTASPSAGRRCGRSPRSGSAVHAPPVPSCRLRCCNNRSGGSVKRAQLDPTAHAERRAHDPEFDERR